MFNPELGMATLILGGSIAILIGSVIIYLGRKTRLKLKKKRK